MLTDLIIMNSLIIVAIVISITINLLPWYLPTVYLCYDIIIVFTSCPSIHSLKKTSPPSARVAAMSDMQQKTFKNKTTLKHHHKSFKLLLNTLTFSWNFLKNSRGVYSFLDSYILPCSLSKPQPNLNTRLGLTIK